MATTYVRSFVSILLATGLAVVGAPRAVAQNLQNGDFDLWSGSNPSYWTKSASSGTATTSQDTTTYYSASDWAGNAKSCKLTLVKGTSPATTGWFGKTWTISGGGFGTSSTITAKFRVKLSSTLSSGSITAEATGLDLFGNPVGTPATVALAINTTAWQTAEVSYVLPSPLPKDVYLRVRFVNVPNTNFNVDGVVFNWTSDGFLGGLPRDPVREPYDLVAPNITVRIDQHNGNIADILSTVGATTTSPGTRLIEPPNSADETSRLFMLKCYRRDLSTIFPDSGVFVHGADSFNHYGVSPQFTTSVTAGIRNLMVAFDGGYFPNGSGVDLLDMKPMVVVSCTPFSNIGVSFSISVDNYTYQGQTWDPGQAKWAIEEVMTPLPQMAPVLGASSTDDRLFIPLQSGNLLVHDALTYTNNVGNTLMFDYPGSASMQYMAYFDANVGMLMMSADGTAVTSTSGPSPKAFGYQRRIGPGSSPPTWFDLRIARRFPLQFGDDAGTAANPLPPVVLRETHGSWMTPAETYRQWAKQQPWYQAPTDQPAWIATRPTTFALFLRPEAVGLHTALVHHSLSFEPLYDLFDGWSADLGPMMALLRSFEHNGLYVGPYFAPFTNAWFDETELRDHCIGLRSQHNVQIMAMIAGLKWMTDRPQFPTNSDCSQHLSYWIEAMGAGNTTAGGGNSGLPGVTIPPAADVCVQDITGQPYDPWATETPPEWDGHHYLICPSTDFAKDLHSALALYSTGRGIQLYEFDQMLGGRTPVCYARPGMPLPEHPHLPGYGTWMTSHVHEVFEQARNSGRSVDNTFVLGVEDPCELFIPQIDVVETPVGTFSHPFYSQQCESVPAFQYVYGGVTEFIDQNKSVQVKNIVEDSSHSLHDRTAHEIARVGVAGGWLGIDLWSWMLVKDLKDTQYSSFNCANAVPWTMGAVNDFFVQNNLTPPAEDAIVPYVDKTNVDLRTLLKNLCDVTHDAEVYDLSKNGGMIDTTGWSTATVTIDDRDGTGSWVTRNVPAVHSCAYRKSDGQTPPHYTYGLLLVNATDSIQTVTLPTKFGNTNPAGSSYSTRLPLVPFQPSGNWPPGPTFPVPVYGVVFFKIN